MQEISEMVSRPLHLGAGGCQHFFLLAEACVPLHTGTARPVLKNGFNGPEMFFTNFLENPTKA